MYYPILLNVKGRKVVVVGGGAVAFQKLKTFEGTGATVTIISPTIHEDVERWVLTNESTWLCKQFEEKDIEEADVIIAATNDPNVNDTIRQHAKKGQLVLQVDDAKKGDFIVPAVVRRGKLSIAISTDGASPSLTRKIKKEIDEQFDERFGEYVDFLDEARQFILNKIKDPTVKRQCLRKLLDSKFYELTMEEKYDARNEHLQQIIKEGETT